MSLDLDQMLSNPPETTKAIGDALGRTLTGITLVDDQLRLALDNGLTLVLCDGGQQCCEHRFMTCDDDLTGFDGATLLEVGIRTTGENEWGEKGEEIQFLVIRTSKGDVTACTHNDHNGYYSGFLISASLVGDVDNPRRR